jgi:hypothetical protein
MGSIMAISPIDDPVFAAHHPIVSSGSVNQTVYISDNFFGVLGCVEQVLAPHATALICY